MKCNIDAVVVVFNPEIDVLLSLIDSLRDQVRIIYLINNGQNSDASINLGENVVLVNLKRNMGVAFAQNYGIKISLDQNADFVLISDQDTCYPPDFIDNMMIDEFVLDARAAAVAPLFIDLVKGGQPTGFYMKTSWGFSMVENVSGCQEIAQAISSGLLIKSSVLRDVGLMSDELFIDWVDFEWCWRARHRGFKILGNADVIIQHKLGDQSIVIGSRKVSSRSPVRHYYITRNAFYLSLYSEVLDRKRKLGLFIRSVRYLIGYPLLFSPRLNNLKAVTQGLYHGVFKQLGEKGDYSGKPR